jgi:hypothetical protein
MCEAASTRFRAGRQPDHLAATGLGEAAVPSGRQPQSTEPLFPRGDVCCTRQPTGDFCADPFLRFRQCGSCRQARALDSATLRLARQGGGRWKTSRATVVRGEHASCAEKRTGEATYAGESARTRWSCRGARDLRISRPGDSTGEHTGQKETALWARWGAHRERVEADA